MKKAGVIVIFLFCAFQTQSSAKEGLWMPTFIEQLNYDDLKANGFKLTAEDIYAINQASLSDAVIIFGLGCTGGVVSDEGLLFTNYHCGFGRVQKHSSVENNYIHDGFWAKSREEELPNKGLTVKFLVRIDDFTSKIMEGIDPGLNFSDKQPYIQEAIKKYEKAIEDTSDYLASIEQFYYGNEYYLFLYNEFKDIRLVGAPPEFIGDFGGDADNWIWPRHTADFSVFRIYTGPDGKSAPYSKDNIPYKPKRSFSISAKGVKEGDFTMVLGYPGTTAEYLYSAELELYNDIVFPNRIKLRTGRLDIIRNARNANEKVYIEYAVKQRRIANSWKKWIGVLHGFNQFKVIEKRKDYEKWLLANAGERKNELKDIYEAYEDVYLGFKSYKMAVDFFMESINAIEPFRLANRVRSTVGTSSVEIKDDKNIEKLERIGKSHFTDYLPDLDIKLTKFLLNSYLEDMDESHVPEVLMEKHKQGKLDEYLNTLYEKSAFTSKENFSGALGKFYKGKTKTLFEDPVYLLFEEFIAIYVEQLIEDYKYYAKEIQNLNYQYMLVLQEIDKERKFYPDANFTMRMSYGKVKGYSPSDAVEYECQSYLKGLVEKVAAGADDYNIDNKLMKLYQEKEYGKYCTEEGNLPLCFIASNHTSGGNSGSPVLDAEGNLIGLNFDRTWESTMSDYNFDENICRNIAVDVRYILFVMDKYAEAGYLLDEMNILW